VAADTSLDEYGPVTSEMRIFLAGTNWTNRKKRVALESGFANSENSDQNGLYWVLIRYLRIDAETF